MLQNKPPASSLKFRCRTILLVCGFIVLLPLTSCSTDSRLPGFVFYRISANPSTLDPALIVDVTGGAIAAKIFNGLVRLNPKLEVVPDLAQSWSVSSDGREYEFRLRKGVLFSDGREVTSDDVRFSFLRVLDPAGRSPNTWVLDRILGARDYLNRRSPDLKGIQIRDRYTIVLRLEQPFAPFPRLLAMTAAYIVSRASAMNAAHDFGTRPVGSGPFELESWLQSDRIVLKRRADYFGGAPKAAGLVYRILPEDLTAVSEFELGNIDILMLPSSVIHRFLNSDLWQDNVLSADGMNIYYLGMNCSRPPLDDRRMRQAIAQAIDRKRILSSYLGGRGEIAAGPVPPLLRDWHPPALQPFDPEGAKLVLAPLAASGRTLEFYVPADHEVVDIAEIIQSYLHDAGLRIRIRQLEWSAFKDAVTRGEPDLFWLSWWADYADPENFLFPLFHSSNHGAGGNRTRFSSPDVDRLIEAGQRAATRAERSSYYGMAEQAIADEAPWVFFWHKREHVVHADGLKGMRLYPVYSMDKGEEIHR